VRRRFDSGRGKNIAFSITMVSGQARTGLFTTSLHPPLTMRA